MKYIIAIAVMTIVIGGIVLSSKNKNVYVAPEKVFVEVEKQVSDIDVRIKQAQETAEKDVKETAQSAYDRAYAQAMLEIELRVTSEFRGEIEEREKVLQASSTAY